MFLITITLLSVMSLTAQVTDKDGNTYKTVVIGTQTWMAENLNVTRFRNGETIPEAKTNEEWNKADINKTPAWCYYDNDPENGKKYGKLYNWYALNDSRGLAPEGWLIPDDVAWSKLREYLGGDAPAGVKMKSTNVWPKYASAESTNTSGFTALPGGFRSKSSSRFIGYAGYWWCLTKPDYDAWCYSLSFDVSLLHNNSVSRSNGYAVRCNKN